MFFICAIGVITFTLLVWIYKRNSFNEGVVRGRRVLITGASSGIGEELACYYARLGASVFITARREELLIQVVEKCASVGLETAKHGYCVADMAKYQTETKRVVQEAVKLLGGLDTVVINHANLGCMQLWFGTQENLDLFDDMLKVNLSSFVHLASHALPYLEKSKQGRIGIIGSITGKMPWVTIPAYNACKFALDGFFSSWSMELQQAKDKLTIAHIMPGFIGTNNAMGILQGGIGHYQSAGNRLLKLANTKFATAKDMAYQALRATETGQRELYYPFLYRSAYFTMPAWAIPLIRHFLPTLLPPMVWMPELYAEQKKVAGLVTD